MEKATRKLVIVGGGTAGWITASLVAAEMRHAPERRPEITLIESPDIPIIGVGEGTWPSMRLTLKKIGIPESRLLGECGASFKQGTCFRGWTDNDPDQYYYHPFSFPVEYSNINLAGFWLQNRHKLPFADLVTPQARVIKTDLAPKQASTPEYAFAVNYGYHFDAGRFARMLHDHAVNELGVHYVSGNVQRVNSDESGDIASLELDTGETVDGDLFVDCTGQRALLIGEHYGVPFESVKDVLFNDRAIAVQVEHTDPNAPLPSVTLSTATKAGWIWDIALQERRGIGHVYASLYMDDDEALTVVRDYVARTSPGVDLDSLKFRNISFEPGHRSQFWVNNCVAVGLSGGFIEPLEASALALIEQSAGIISQQFPVNREIMPVIARRFNERMHYHWERLIEFLKLHYVLSKRNDSDYWRACHDLKSCPAGLQDKLAAWKQQPPWHDDSPRVDELFPSASYQYVLYGMGFIPTHAFLPGTDPAGDQRRAEELMKANFAKTQQMINLLPTNRGLINAILSNKNMASE